jgi:hypothetical protein
VTFELADGVANRSRINGVNVMAIQNSTGDESGVRGLLRKYPAVIVGVLAVGIGVALWMSLGSMGRPGLVGYYSDDDGKTLLKISANEAPPFSRMGREVLGAVVVSCDGGRTLTVAFLVRYSGETKKRADKVLFQHGVPMPAAEVRKPGTTEWINTGNVSGETPEHAVQRMKKVSEIKNYKCPDGSSPILMQPE